MFVRHLLCAAFVLLVATRLGAQPPLPPPLVREFRGAWISPTEGGDWPSRPGLSIAEQKAELVALLDRAQADGLNAILLHVRVAGDALYPSALAPWSRYLVGRGVASVPADYATYDPLALAVAEAHKRGLQLHAWFNPFRATAPDDLGAPLPGHVTRAHPAWVHTYGSSKWIDPGIPAARRAVLDAILDVVNRYDVDGVHLDDYFYPYREEQRVTRTVRRGKRRVRITRTVTLPFGDDAAWKKYGRARGWKSRADWRRANVNDFVRTLYQEVKARKPWVLVGISPFGIWRPGHPAGITGLDAYAETYADARKWLRAGWLDYLSPQLYWPLGNAQQRFTRLDAWWRGQNVKRRHIWPGLFTMRVGSREDPWPWEEIAHEIATLRDVRAGTPEAQGHVHFRMRTLDLAVSDTTTLGSTLRYLTYAEPALLPAAPWLGARAPAPPTLAAEREPAVVQQSDADSATRGATSQLVLNVRAGDSVSVRWWVVQELSVDGRWSTHLFPAGTGRLELGIDELQGADWIAVRALSRSGVAGPAARYQLSAKRYP